MGIVDILRFLSQFNRGTGDYTQERGEWLDQWSLDEIIKEIKIKRNEPTSWPRDSIKSLFGLLKARKRVSLEAMDAAIREHAK